MFARNSRTLSLMLLVAAGACSDSITGPQVGPAPEMLFNHSVGDPQQHTYTFDDCTDLLAYEDLTVEILQGTASCGSGQVVLGPLTQIRITLGGTAASVSADLTGDAIMLLFNQDGDPYPTGPDDVIRSVEILTLFLGGTLDNLVVDYVTVDESGGEDPAVPTTKDECKDGGWQSPEFEALGFKNQGQCVRFVETGKDPIA